MSAKFHALLKRTHIPYLLEIYIYDYTGISPSLMLVIFSGYWSLLGYSWVLTICVISKWPLILIL